MKGTFCAALSLTLKSRAIRPLNSCFHPVRVNRSGFTLVELMITIAIIAILVAIALPRFQNLMLKSREGATKGNLGVLRSALSVYFGDTQIYPYDNLGSLQAAGKYIQAIPQAKTPPYHDDNSGVILQTVPSDTGQWSYNNDDSTDAWGEITVGCLHKDVSGAVWTTY